MLSKVSRVQGTFLVRPSLSLAGAMVLSVVVGSVVKHMALDGNQLDTRSLEVRPEPATLHATPAGRRSSFSTWVFHGCHDLDALGSALRCPANGLQLLPYTPSVLVAAGAEGWMMRRSGSEM